MMLRPCCPYHSAAALVLLLMPSAGLAAEDAGKRMPVPDAAAQARAMTVVREVFSGEFEGVKGSAEGLALAKKMLDQATSTAGDPAERFVLLRLARDLAEQAADPETALEAVDQIARTFEVDPIAMKVECLIAVGRAARSASQHGVLAERAFAMLDSAVAEDRYEAAGQLGEIARESARKAHNYTLLKQVVARMTEIQTLREACAQYQNAMARLEKDPTDPEANLLAGRYLCLIKGDWDAGVPMLALSSDGELKTLASQELQGATSPDAQVALADAWWDLAHAREGMEKEAFLLRAGDWYRQAQSKLPSGLVKAKVDARLNEIAEFGRLAAEIWKPSGAEPPRAVAPFDTARAKELQGLWGRHLRVPIEITNSIGMKLVLIPPGEFDMGSQPSADQGRRRGAGPGRRRASTKPIHDDVPQHRVKLTAPFYAGVCEVTQFQYQLVMGQNPSRFKTAGPRGRLLPVDTISWHAAAGFCARLSASPQEKRAGRVYRLPTEAEWEYVCRAGTTTRYHFGDALSPTQANVNNRLERTTLVGSCEPNAWGLHDMHGNLREWCLDWYDESYYQSSPQSDPKGPARGTMRVIRGGYFKGGPGDAGSAYRLRSDPSQTHVGYGFRVVCSLKRFSARR